MSNSVAMLLRSLRNDPAIATTSDNAGKIVRNRKVIFMSRHVPEISLLYGNFDECLSEL